MNNPLHFLHAGALPAASDTDALVGQPPAGPAHHPTPESVGFEIGMVLAITLAVAGAVPLVLKLCGVE